MQLTTERNLSRPGGRLHQLTHDLAYMRTAIVNLYFFGRPGAEEWVLIDTGVYGSASAILEAVEERYQGRPPRAIVLTHGHFDHVGAVRELAERWRVPVYAHRLEMPYLTGRSSYPPPDPTVGGGSMAALAWLYPRGPIDLGEHVRPLPDDESVPGMPGWRWIHTPGHTPGHVSLWRESDRSLMAGDAVITTKQESARAVLSQRPMIHGPPMYYTPDWEQARRSAQRLADLEPRLLATGHGRPLSGAGVAEGLALLAQDFDRTAVPKHGRYVGHPAIADEGGVVALPPPRTNPAAATLAGFGAGLAIGGLLASLLRRD